MGRVLRVALVCLAGLGVVVPAAAQYAPEERALLEIVQAQDAATVERHLPEAVIAAVHELPPDLRRRFEERLLFAKALAMEHLQMRVPQDGHAFLVVEPDAEAGDAEPRRGGEILLARKIVNGDEALLRFAIKASDADETGSVEVWMKLEGSEWRVTEFNGPPGTVTLDESFVRRLKQSQERGSEAAAVASLRTLNTAEVTYASTYPDNGFADRLSKLGGSGGSPSSAGLIDPVLASGEKDGYTFTLTMDSAAPYTGYHITARPQRDGRRSFYTDQSGVIRCTEEDREATADDPPIW